jgi:hypothetical protein
MQLVDESDFDISTQNIHNMAQKAQLPQFRVSISTIQGDAE